MPYLPILKVTNGIYNHVMFLAHDMENNTSPVLKKQMKSMEFFFARVLIRYTDQVQHKSLG